MHETDLAIVGAGPAGLAAAAQATLLGVQVTLLDERPIPGGQFFARPAAEDPLSCVPARVLRGMRRSHLQLIRGLVWGAFEGNLLAVLEGDSCRLVKARALIIATGAAERLEPFPGWELDGVISAGAAQMLAKTSRAIPRGPMVVAGTGPFLAAVACQLRKLGADIRLVVESLPLQRLARLIPALAHDVARGAEALSYMKGLAGVPIRFGTDIRAFEGDFLILSNGEQVPCNVVCVGFGFLPRTGLAQLIGCRTGPEGVLVDVHQMTSVPGVFAAGDVTGIGGHRLAEVEGRIAGYAAAVYLGRRPPAPPPARWLRLRRRYRYFARRLWSVYRQLPSLTLATPETVLCRCEGVTVGEVQRTRDRWDIVAEPRDLKALLRCGMGPCQGMLCERGVAAWTLPSDQASAGFTVRPPLVPVPISTVGSMEARTP